MAATFEELKDAFDTTENQITITLTNDFEFNSKIDIINKKVILQDIIEKEDFDALK